MSESILIKETGETTELALIDPFEGYDVTSDELSFTDFYQKHKANDEDIFVLSQAQYDYYAQYLQLSHEINQILANNERLNTLPLQDKINADMGGYGHRTVEKAQATLAMVQSLL